MPQRVEPCFCSDSALKLLENSDYMDISTSIPNTCMDSDLKWRYTSYMERSHRHSLIKRLQLGLHRGTPFDVATLERLGISAKAASYYAKEGWLVRLGHGVYAFPGDQLSPHGAVKFLQTKVKGLHVGGKTALALQGVQHNLALRETLVLWGEGRFVLPAWFTSMTPARYVSAHLFDWPTEKFAESTVTTPPGETEGLRVSTPERATLEMLYQVGTYEMLEETRNVFEGLRNFRTDVAGKLLACCTAVKAVRLFLKWSRETGLLDVEKLYAQFDIRVGSNRRWINRLPDGSLLTLKPNE